MSPAEPGPARAGSSGHHYRGPTSWSRTVVGTDGADDVNVLSSGVGFTCLHSAGPPSATTAEVGRDCRRLPAQRAGAARIGPLPAKLSAQTEPLDDRAVAV